MADNTLTAILPTIMARALLALRSRTVMPALVNREYDPLAKANKGDVVTIPVPSAVGTQAVTTAAVPTAGTELTPTAVSLTLDNWRETDPFFLSDKDLNSIMADENFIPMQISEGVEALASYINGVILGYYTGVYGYVGTAGTTPFSEATPVIDVAADAMGTLNAQKAPQGNRSVVLDWTAHASAASLPAFSNANKRGETVTIKNGELGTVFGMDWFGDGDVPSHTLGMVGTPLLDDGAGIAVGVKTLHMDGFTTKPSVGDVFTIPARATAGVLDDLQTYAVTSSSTLVGNDSDIGIEPGLKIALAAGDDSTPVYFKATHRVNLAFHRDAFAFASRQLMDTDITGSGNFFAMRDPQSGIVLRLEVTRQSKRTNWGLDILFGSQIVRRELACRIAG